MSFEFWVAEGSWYYAHGACRGAACSSLALQATPMQARGKAGELLNGCKAGGFAYFVVCMLLLQETINTDRLVLRPFTLTDAPQVKALAGDREIYETTLFVPYPYEDGMAESWISTHQAGFYEGRGVVFAICLADGALIGAISLNKSGLFNAAELGYWIGVAYWNRGYCTEAAKAVVEYGFNILRYHKISARHFVDNPSSGRVMGKVGMKREGLLQDDVMKDGRYITVELYGIVNPREIGPRGKGNF